VNGCWRQNSKEGIVTMQIVRVCLCWKLDKALFIYDQACPKMNKQNMLDCLLQRSLYNLDHSTFMAGIN